MQRLPERGALADNRQVNRGSHQIFEAPIGYFQRPVIEALLVEAQRVRRISMRTLWRRRDWFLNCVRPVFSSHRAEESSV